MIPFRNNILLRLKMQNNRGRTTIRKIVGTGHAQVKWALIIENITDGSVK